MSKEYEHYHGVAFTKLIQGAKWPISIGVYPSENNASYVVDNKCGLYLKYSTKRTSPWSFTFLKDHQYEILKMYEQFGEVFIGLICRDDGIAMLSYSELKAVLDANIADSEWLRVTRGRRTQYAISGSDGKLDCKVSLRSCPEKLLDYLSVRMFEQPHTSSFSIGNYPPLSA